MKNRVQLTRHRPVSPRGKVTVRYVNPAELGDGIRSEQRRRVAEAERTGVSEKGPRPLKWGGLAGVGLEK